MGTRSRNRAPLLWLCTMLALVLTLFASGGSAQERTQVDARTTIDADLDRIERALRGEKISESGLHTWLEAVARARTGAEECVGANEAELAKASASLASLGEPVAREPADVAQTRKTLASAKQKLEQEIARCRVLVLRAEDLAGRISAEQQKRIAERLLARGPTVTALLLNSGGTPSDWIASSEDFIAEHSGVNLLTSDRLVLLGAIFVVTLVFGLRARVRLRAWAGRMRTDEHLSTQLTQALGAVYAYYAPYLLTTLGFAIVFYHFNGDLRPVPFLALIAYGLPAFVLLMSLIDLFLAPRAPAQLFMPLPAPVAKALARRLKVLVFMVFAGYLLFATLLSQTLPEHALLLTRAVFAFVFVLNLVWALWLMNRIPQLAATQWLRGVLTLPLIGVVIAEWLGYRTLAFFVLRAILGTLLLAGALRLLTRVFRELYDGLAQGRHRWQRAVRRWVGLDPEDRFPGLGWLRPLTVVLLWTGFLLVLVRLWGMTEVGFEQLRAALVTGFDFGSLRVVPAKILLALLTLAVLLTATGWLKSRLERTWLEHTHIDRGARESLVTISGYVGVAVAVLVALAIAGMEFSNLAIVAGALSVGIGFGLQNIVNNFVSGLILLFERPIKTGDWIVVGNTEGYVKRISIRSTQIQTFDQADVIVPNSELISGQVTNWMLRDPMGRVRVPVGVAYGSDTGLVKRLLLEVAAQHPLVMTGGPAPEPKVLFLAFGESSLDFELRAFIRNIDQRLSVISDLNFAIDAAFRANGVEIPFPQRDLHVRDWPKGDAPKPPLPDAESP